jgi:hypothetical protein
LFLTGRISSFNTCIKRNNKCGTINVEISLNTKTRLRDQEGPWPLSLVLIFYACVDEGCYASLTIAREKQT